MWTCTSDVRRRLHTMHTETAKYIQARFWGSLNMGSCHTNVNRIQLELVAPDVTWLHSLMPAPGAHGGAAGGVRAAAAHGVQPAGLGAGGGLAGRAAHACRVSGVGSGGGHIRR